jgi:hypothetical protein
MEPSKTKSIKELWAMPGKELRAYLLLLPKDELKRVEKELAPRIVDRTVKMLVDSFNRNKNN